MLFSEEVYTSNETVNKSQVVIRVTKTVVIVFGGLSGIITWVERRTECSQCCISIPECGVQNCWLYNYALYSMFVLVVFWPWVIFLNFWGRKKKKSNYIIFQLKTPNTPIVKKTSSIFSVWSQKLFPVPLRTPLSLSSHAPRFPTALTPCVTHTYVSECSPVVCPFACPCGCSERHFSVLYPSNYSPLLILCPVSSLHWCYPHNPQADLVVLFPCSHTLKKYNNLQ